MLAPMNFKKWIDDNRAFLKPPVGNRCVYEDSEFIIMVVGGPNKRKDFHVNQSEEFFYQLEGDMILKVREGAEINDLIIREGDIFLLPPRVPHSPQRSENTVGLVVERKRRSGEEDGFIWYCDQCGAKVYDHFFFLTDIVKQLPPIFETFYSKDENCICKKCGHKNTKD
ncbi:3-hydroxyanthranilate 3,4-dioxygenase [Pseudobacteriovorax antillogorgiicola]|uniref:3-hydroxyanthranilate 3,4-dioxygenase n=1 Tax=Pseudobacteriovorax antillogorgiicola TaxID=1513793 RepID=A0A1Y6CF27_9BACT|nr:3-hydroxyanthranilate 3,4-dioxygenase [Pseudobacteriovorax antillogorgiicola]TCS47639.1 3-hydroxyanthranilate 3,4-dioxygenase [Pseudobacteriovorax antillogorgiicola]SMF59911.1 3-hydroxyanthranilate 3,4-dioxygenase [Pseudobacteriovorax antillogorgiicola]